MGDAVRATDWSATPLGAIESWPPSLRTTVSLCLASNFPIALAWGPEHIQVYNDAYWPFCGDKHPGSLGQNFTECWSVAWPIVGDAFARAFEGEASFLEDARMFLDRHGYLEEAFFTFSFSPVRDETGGVGGIFHPVTETTNKMLGERRTRALRDLATRAGQAQTVEEAIGSAATSLDDCDVDVPFALFYLLDHDRGEGRLVASAGLSPGAEASPVVVDFDPGADAVWPLAEVARSGQSVAVALETRFASFSCPPYPESLQMAVALPITPPGSDRPLAILIAGASPRLPLNDAYYAFYDLLAAGVTTAVASARSHEDERRRAEALAEIDLAKTLFFSNVSHEFRTPLTLMLGPLEDELAERDAPLPSPRRDRLATAHRNTLRLLKLVNSLLDFSRIEAGRVDAHFEPCDLAAETAELASVFRSAIEKAGLTLTVDCAPLPETVYVDREMWEKVMLNLLSNALKHTFTGGIGVALRWHGDHAELAVSDSGIGIAKSELPRLFERFHRVEGARSRSYEGTGIGLALVQQLAVMHGGTVDVASYEGAGTTFRVTVKTGTDHLPPESLGGRARRPSVPPQAPAFVEESMHWLRRTPSPSMLPPPDEGTRPRVLLADDNADMRDYVRRLLSKRYEVVSVPDGVAALASALERPPDLVVTDVMMPGLDGFGLLRALRASEATRTVPIIVLSARAGDDASAQGLDAGADDYLVKPFSARDLLARVRTHLELSRVRREWANEVKIREACQETEEALRSSEARLRRVIDSAIIGMTIIRLDEGVFTQANDAFLRIIGYSRDEIVGGKLPVAAISPPEWRARDEEATSQLRTSGVLPLREREYVHKSGTRVPVLVGGAMLDETTCVGYVADIADRKQAEAALQRSQAHFAALYGSGVVGIAVGDESGRITEANDAFLRMVGYWRDDMTSGALRWADVTPAEWRDRNDAAIRQVKARGFADTWEQEYVRKDKTRLPVLVGIAAIDERETIRLVADLSERRRGEEAKARLEVTVRKEKVGRERAEEALRQKDEQLRQAQKMEAVGRLAGGVAHDFNNILSVVLSYAEIALLEANPTGTLREDIEEIKKAGKRGAEITRQLLMFSHQQVLEPKVLSLNHLLTGMAKMLRSLVGEDVELIAAPGPDVGRVRADPGSLEQVIMNLVVNARDAMPRGGRLTIETSNVTLDDAYARDHLGVTPGPHVLLAVTDTGMGMDEATQARIFEPFFTTKEKGKGTGLGLSTVFGIVQQSKGSLWVDSEVGKGTTFEVYLPLIDGPIDERRAPIARTSRGSETILLVEDEEQVRAVASAILRHCGYRVLEASTGVEAFALCANQAAAIDLLLSDIVMPQMSGPELARRLVETRPAMKVVFMSGHMGDALDRAVDVPIAFIQKPFTPDSLARMVRDELDGPRAPLPDKPR
jgi:PAS domain S-box-containing protein